MTIAYRTDNEMMCDDPPLKSLADAPAEVLSDHFIPQDKSLWTLENYEMFCEQREKLLAEGIGKLLHDLGIQDDRATSTDSNQELLSF